jgi:hypothetical protein
MAGRTEVNRDGGATSVAIHGPTPVTQQHHLINSIAISGMRTGCMAMPPLTEHTEPTGLSTSVEF